jgi:hypothetical protein
MPKAALSLRDFPDVQSCLNEVRVFLNALAVENEEGHFLSKPLYVELMKAHSAVCVLVRLFDPGSKYIKTGSCPDGLPRC